jgi:ParB family chromosome partitioning protein
MTEHTDDFASLFDEVSDTEEVLKLPLNKIKSRKQSRKRFRNLDGLGQTLKRQQEQPIIVGPMEEDGQYPIQKGERRWRAAGLVELETLDAIVRPWPEKKADVAYGELTENIQRDGYAPLELAEALQELREDGQTQQEIADGIGRSKSWVASYLALLKVHPDILQLGDDDVITDKDSLFKLGQIYDLDKEHALQMAEIAREDGLSRKQINDALKNLKKKNEPDSEEQSQLSTEVASDTEVQSDASLVEEAESSVTPAAAQVPEASNSDKQQESPEATNSEADSKAPEAGNANTGAVVQKTPESHSKAGNKPSYSGAKIKIVVSHDGKDAELVVDGAGGPAKKGTVHIKTAQGIVAVPGNETTIVSVSNG